MKRLVVATALLLALGYCLTAMAQEPIILPITGDTYLNVDAINYSSQTHLRTYTWPAGQPANASLMKFDLSPLPAGSTIVHATLSLYLEDWLGSAPYHVAVHRIINKNPVLTAATGQTFDGINAWTANSCCFNSIPLAQADIAPAAHFLLVSGEPGYKHWHVTTILRAWMNDPTTVFGLLINSDRAASVDTYRYFASSEGYTDRRPLLIVGYTGTSTPYRSVTLTWQDNANNEDGFYVESRAYQPTGAFVRDVTLAVNAGTWSTVLPATEERCYRVQAFNTAGPSEFSNEACALVNFLWRYGIAARPPVTNRPPVMSRPQIP